MNPLRNEIIGEFYSAEFNNLKNIVQRKLGSRYNGHIEDIVHNSFLKILNTEAFHNPQRGSLKSWMNKIIYNTAMDYMERKQTKLYIHEKYDINIPTNPKSNPLTQIIDKESLDNLESKINELPSLEQHLIRNKIDGNFQKNTANELGISRNCLKWKILNAKNKLQ